jgi:hypothetical protein
LDSALLGTTECGLLKLDTNNGLDGELNVGINVNSREGERDDVDIEEGEVNTLSGGKVEEGRGGTGSLGVQKVAVVGVGGRIDGNLLGPSTLDASLIGGNIGTEIGTLRSTSVLEQEGRLGDGASNITEDTEGTLGTNVDLDLSAEVLRLELNIDGGEASGIVGITERAVVGVTAASNLERVTVATVQIANVGEGHHEVTVELVANGVGVTGLTVGKAVNIKRTLRSGLGVLVVDGVASASGKILKSPFSKSKGPLERSSQHDATIGAVDVVLTREQNLLGNDSGLEVNIRENGDVGRDGNSLGEGNLDRDDVLQVALNRGATESREVLSVLNSDHRAISGVAGLDVVILVPAALESSTPRDGSGVGLNTRVGIVGRGERGRSGLDILVPEETGVLATSLGGVSGGGNVTEEKLGARTTLNERRLDVEDQAVVFITVGLDTVDVTSNQGREVGGKSKGSTEVGILALRVSSSVQSAVGTIHARVAVAKARGTANAKTGILVRVAESRSAQTRSGLRGRLGANGSGNDASASAVGGQGLAARTDLDGLSSGDSTSGISGQENLKDGVGDQVSREGEGKRGKTLTSQSDRRGAGVGNSRESSLTGGEVRKSVNCASGEK